MKIAKFIVFLCMISGFSAAFGMETAERELEEVRQANWRVEFELAFKMKYTALFAKFEQCRALRKNQFDFLRLYALNKPEILIGQSEDAQEVKRAFGQELIEQVKVTILHDLQYDPDKLQHYSNWCNWTDEVMQSITDKEGKSVLQLIQESQNSNLRAIFESKLELIASWQMIESKKEENDSDGESKGESSQQEVTDGGYVDWLLSFTRYSNENKS